MIIRQFPWSDLDWKGHGTCPSACPGVEMDMTTSPSEIIMTYFCTYAIETKHASPKLATHIQWKPISCLDRSRSPRGPLISCFKASRKLSALVALQSRKRRQGCPKSAEIDNKNGMQSSDIDDIEVCEVCEALPRVAECEASEISRSFQFFFLHANLILSWSILLNAMIHYKYNIALHQSVSQPHCFILISYYYSINS